MRRFIFTALAVLGLSLLVSGCVSSPTPEDCGGCADRCEGNVLLTGGVCWDGACRLAAQTCEFGCSGTACLPRPPHLELSDNEETVGNFTVRIDSVTVRLGDFRDEYDVSMMLANTANASSVFSVTSVILLSKTGRMHTATGFSWSDMLEPLEERDVSFTIRRVPDDRRNQETTIILRTNQGQYSFPATFVS
jgi:hypothetical protein